MTPINPAGFAGAIFAGTIADVPGIAAGHWTDARAATGCTAILCGRDGAVGGVAVRGGSPGTSETDLLNPIRRVERVHAILLSGGSAFGLATAGGARQWLAERGIGFPTPHGPVPIVPAAILYDLGIGSARIRPDAAAGYAACAAADADISIDRDRAASLKPGAAAPPPLAVGSVGAGAGATVAKGYGIAGAVKGGFGTARCLLPPAGVSAASISTAGASTAGISVAAAVAVNAWGGVYDHRNGRLLAGPRRPDGGMADPVAVAMALAGVGAPPAADASLPVNTTIGVIATDAALDKMQANFVASSAHDGLALTVRPCHLPNDGDTLFCVATGANPTPVNLMTLVAAATEVTARAVINAIRSATGLAGVPAAGQWAGEK